MGLHLGWNADDADPFPVELPGGSTATDLLKHMGIPREAAKLVFVNHSALALDVPLADGVRIEIFPPVAGG